MTFIGIRKLKVRLCFDHGLVKCQFANTQRHYKKHGSTCFEMFLMSNLGISELNGFPCLFYCYNVTKEKE